MLYNLMIGFILRNVPLKNTNSKEGDESDNSSGSDYDEHTTIGVPG